MEDEYLDEIRKLNDLKNEGILTEEEFNRKKEILLFGTKSTKKQQNRNGALIKNKLSTNEMVFSIIMAALFGISISMLCFSRVEVGSYGYGSGSYLYFVNSPFTAGDIRTAFSIVLIVLLPIAIIVNVISTFYKNTYFKILKHFLIILTLTFGFLTFIFNLVYNNSDYFDIYTLFGVIFIGIATIVELILILKVVFKFFINLKNANEE